MNETSRTWRDGWTFYREPHSSRLVLPKEPSAVAEWLQGFAAALSAEPLPRRDPTLQTALMRRGIDGDLLEDLLRCVEALLSSDRPPGWPEIAVRGFGSEGLRLGPFMIVLPGAANDPNEPE